MRVKILLAAGIPALLLAVAAGLQWGLSYRPGKDPWPIEKKYLSYFPETYEQSRQMFRSACSVMKKSRSEAFNIPSRTDEDLTMDVCRLRAVGRTKTLLILASGLHGGEAYASGAVQRLFLEQLASGKRPEVLAIHAINPWGMKHFRRGSENNVDLNRNFSADTGLFATENEGYGRLADFLSPAGKYSASAWTETFFPLRSLAWLIRHGKSRLRQSIMQGQYQFPRGMYFGGRGPEPQQKIITEIISKAAKGRKRVVAVDIHTGYGTRGTLHLFASSQGIKSRTRRLITDLYRDNPVDWGDATDFYDVKGDFLVYLGELMPAAAEYVPMAFEYGTVNTQTMSGAIHGTKTMVAENHAFHSGAETPEDMKIAREEFREMFYPSSPSWRSHIMKEGERIFRDIRPRL